MSGGSESSTTTLEALKQVVRMPQRDAVQNRRASMSAARARRMVVVILDELDQLISQDQAVLYELFKLPQVWPLTCHGIY
jgi:Cdc6-like AAA superfamily ATPase